MEERNYVYCWRFDVCWIERTITLRSKKNKACYFPGGKTENLRCDLIPYLKKEPDNIIIDIGTNNSHIKRKILYTKNW